jgi:hypothetical protein
MALNDYVYNKLIILDYLTRNISYTTNIFSYFAHGIRNDIN